MISIFANRTTAAKSFAMQVAKDYVEEGASRAEQVWSSVQAEFLAKCYADTDLARFLVEKDSRLIL